jgi:hypothetical protein
MVNEPYITHFLPCRKWVTNVWEMKIYTSWDALTRQRTDGALVRLITLGLPGEQSEDAEKRLQDFTKEIVPILNEFIPS